jgi:hypothetical protein
MVFEASASGVRSRPHDGSRAARIDRPAIGVPHPAMRQAAFRRRGGARPSSHASPCAAPSRHRTASFRRSTGCNP